jgi:hypothetical protein
MRFSKKTIEEKLILYQLALKNAQEDEEVRTLVANYGYDAAKLNHAMGLYSAADALTREQKAKYSAQFETTRAFHILLEECGPIFEEHYGLARIAFRKAPSNYNMLGLKTPVKRTYPGLIAQAKDFYHNSLNHPSVVEALAGFGVTLESLQAAKLLVAQVETAYVEKERARTEAQYATRLRNEAFRQLKEWMDEFLGVCQFALNVKPELIEKVGILYRSSKYSPSSGAETETPPPPEPEPTG